MRIMTTAARMALYLLARPDGVPIAMSNAALAEALGTSTRNVRRCVSQLSEQGAIQLSTAGHYDKETGVRRITPVHGELRKLLTSVQNSSPSAQS